MSRFSAVPETRSYRSSSIAVEPSSKDTLRSRRFSRTISIYDDVDSTKTNSNGIYSNGIETTSEVNGLSTEPDIKPEYKYSSGYVRCGDI